jgi:tripartite-type tricarboxylate transporter receptor subunit TctC
LLGSGAPPDVRDASGRTPLHAAAASGSAQACKVLLAGGASLGATNLKAAIELARKTPGLPYGSAGNGSPMHFAGEMLKKSTKADLMHVPYKGVAPSITVNGSRTNGYSLMMPVVR